MSRQNVKADSREEFRGWFGFALQLEVYRQLQLGNLQKSDVEHYPFMRDDDSDSTHRLELDCYELVHLLHKYTGRKVLILVDEYDTPVVSAVHEELYEYVSN